MKILIFTKKTKIIENIEEIFFPLFLKLNLHYSVLVNIKLTVTKVLPEL